MSRSWCPASSRAVARFASWTLIARGPERLRNAPTELGLVIDDENARGFRGGTAGRRPGLRHEQRGRRGATLFYRQGEVR